MAKENVLKFAVKLSNDPDFREKVLAAENTIAQDYGTTLNENQKDYAFTKYIQPIAEEAGVGVTVKELKDFLNF